MSAVEMCGVVVAVGGEAATIRVVRDGCDQCADYHRCSMAASSTQELLVDARNDLGAQVGQHVTLAQSAGLHVRNACILFLIPSICAVIGAGVGHECLAARLEVDAVVVGAVSGLVALVVGFIPAIVTSRRNDSLPHVTAIIGEETGGNP